jgi:hypothetical protein
MNRWIIREQVIYGHFSDYIQTAKEMQAYAASKGWAEWTIFVPLTGAGNDVVYEAQYATLADLEQEMNMVMSDARFNELNRSQAAHLVQGSSVSEILVSLDET